MFVLEVDLTLKNKPMATIHYIATITTRKIGKDVKEINGKTLRFIKLERKAGKLSQLIDDVYDDIHEIHCGYNGYGYQHHHYYYIMSAYQFNKIRKMLISQSNAKTDKKPIDKVAQWCNRLVKLTNITLDEAQQIADEKLAYQDECIAEVEKRQQKRYSHQRSKLISKMKRENPLRRIVDADHAFAILSASRRHNNTNYDSLLEDYRDEVRIGNIDYADVRELARLNYR